jgi:hypothetical protein
MFNQYWVDLIILMLMEALLTRYWKRLFDTSFGRVCSYFPFMAHSVRQTLRRGRETQRLYNYLSSVVVDARQ